MTTLPTEISALFEERSSRGKEIAERLRELADLYDDADKATDALALSSTEPPGSDAVLKAVRRYLAARRRRERLFGAEWFADPAWDMMLDLLACQLERRRVSITGACFASGVPPTTALRWLTKMVEGGILQRMEDNDDGRRAHVVLAPAVADQLIHWVSSTLLRQSA